MDRIAIRPARPDEGPALTEIAYASKRTWGYPEATLDEWNGPLAVLEEHLLNEAYFVAEEERAGRIVAVGFFSLMPVERTDTLDLDHFWVLPEAQGRGVGRLMFERAVLEARKAGALRLTITAEPRAEGFYLKMGAVRTGGKPTVVGGQRHILPLLELPLD
ncbi:MAG: GNAT family N-acetyltransferase [Synergistales bacterium]